MQKINRSNVAGGGGIDSGRGARGVLISMATAFVLVSSDHAAFSQEAKPEGPSSGIVGEKGRQQRNRGNPKQPPYVTHILNPETLLPSTEAKAEFLNKTLRKGIPVEGLAEPTLLTARRPHVPGNAYLNILKANFFSNLNQFTLNSQGHGEAVQVTFKPKEANKPILIALGIASSTTSGASPRIRLQERSSRPPERKPTSPEGPFGGVSQYLPLTRTAQPITLYAVLTPVDNDWQTVDVAVESGLAIFSFIELTPVR